MFQLLDPLDKSIWLYNFSITGGLVLQNIYKSGVEHLKTRSQGVTGLFYNFLRCQRINGHNPSQSFIILGILLTLPHNANCLNFISEKQLPIPVLVGTNQKRFRQSVASEAFSVQYLPSHRRAWHKLWR